MTIMSANVGAIMDNRYRLLAEALVEFSRTHASHTGSRESLFLVDAEMGNIESIMDRYLVAYDEEMFDRLLSIFLNISGFMNIRGQWLKKRAWGLALLEQADQFDTDDQANLLNNIGVTYRTMGDQEQAIEYYLRSIEVRGLDEDDPTLRYSYSNLAVSYWELGELDRALVYAQRGLEIELAEKDWDNAAMSLVNIAGIQYHKGNYQNAIQLVRQALDIVKQTGNVYLQAQYTSQLAIHLVAGLQFDEAKPVHEEGIRLLEAIKDEMGLAKAKFNYGLLCNILKETEKAQDLLAESLETMQRYNMPEEVLVRKWLEKLAENPNALFVDDATSPPGEH